MTTQRDRLAAVLEAELDGRAVFTGPVPPERDVVMLADALIARGVRVVDEATLTSVIEGMHIRDLGPDDIAAAILDRLDGKDDW